MTLDTEFDGGGVERFAILKLDAGAQLKHQAFVAVGPIPLGRELRHETEFGVDIDQFVAQCGKDDATGEGPGHGRVEHVGVVGQPDTQDLIRRSHR